MGYAVCGFFGGYGVLVVVVWSAPLAHGRQGHILGADGRLADEYVTDQHPLQPGGISLRVVILCVYGCNKIVHTDIGTVFTKFSTSFRQPMDKL